MAPAKERNAYFDFLRGIAIIMVVGIHTFPAESVSLDTFNGIISIVVRQILNAAVPIFLAISGFFIASKDYSMGSRQHLDFLKRQIKKIYIPVLIYSIPWLVLDFHANPGNIGLKIANYTLCGYSIYYFVALIIQYYILSPLLMRINNSGGIILTTIISIISISLITYLLKIKHFAIPLLVYAGPFPVWIAFFFLGMYFSKHPYKGSLLYPTIVSIIGLVLSIAEHMYWTSQGSMAFGIKLSSFIFSGCLIWLLFSLRLQQKFFDNAFTKAINYIGGISFGMYLLHMYVVMIVHRYRSINSWIIDWGCVLLLTIGIIYITKLIIPALSKKYLGFK